MLLHGPLMTVEKIYPGELASPLEILRLADEYRKAAHALHPLGIRKKPLSRAPMRLVSIQAIELYLNALLLHCGNTPAKVRGLQHDLEDRTEQAVACGLKLRVKTAEHLKTMGRNREYLVMRYGPEMASTASQINRLYATLEEVSSKVSKLLGTDVSSPDGREFKQARPEKSQGGTKKKGAPNISDSTCPKLQVRSG